jgi:glycerol-3-phosphate dehydrogenase
MHDVAVIGGGVVGSAVALALARRGVDAILLEAEPELALGASGTNSGILHTGFDSVPGELETRLLHRSAELREAVLPVLGVPVVRCGAVVRPRDEGERATVARLAEVARGHGVEAHLDEDGSLAVPGEAVTDPVAYTLALAFAAEACGAQVLRGRPVESIVPYADGLDLGDDLRCRVAVNCAGLHADSIARLVGDDSFSIFPRKGEFLVFDLPRGLDRVLLPVPAERTRGVLVFPTVDRRVVAGPTAHDQEDKTDWSVRDEAREEILAGATKLLPELAGAEPVAAYAGLRPAGRGVNYMIDRSPAEPRLINVAAIRSTGLSASLGIAEHVARLVAAAGVPLGDEAPMPAVEPPAPSGPWWARRRAVTA